MNSAYSYNKLNELPLQDTISKHELKETMKTLADAVSLQDQGSHSLDIHRKLSFKMI